MKYFTLTMIGVLCLFAAPGEAQNASVAGSNMADETSTGVSLGTLLQLQPKQTERLNRLYQDFNARRLAHESKLISTQNFTAPSQNLDAHRVAQRERSVEFARQRITEDLKATRVRSRQTLPPVQLSQLDAFGTDPRYRFRPDSLYLLLLAPIEAFPSQDVDARRNWLDARRVESKNDLRKAAGTGSYGVYGGYSYGGPQLGVYGDYQQGPVGVHAGVGLGGPSVGISIGRVFGFGRR